MSLIEDDISPICFEFKAPYGICYYCEGQAEPSIVVHLNSNGEREKT